MLLYHGTSEWAAQSALTRGLQPRSMHGMDNWNHTVSSNADAVYLTDTWACHYAINAMLSHPRLPDLETVLRKRIAVLEIETRNLVQNKLHPDEDAMEQNGRDKDGFKGTMHERTLFYRTVAKQSSHWQDSLKLLGTCAYYGPISPRHIKRVAYFQPKINPIMSNVMVNGQVSVPAYKFCGYIHRNCIRWLFGDPITPEDIDVMSVRDLGDDAQNPQMAALVQQTNERYGHFARALENRSAIDLVENTWTKK